MTCAGRWRSTYSSPIQRFASTQQGFTPVKINAVDHYPVESLPACAKPGLLNSTYEGWYLLRQKGLAKEISLHLFTALGFEKVQLRLGFDPLSGNLQSHSVSHSKHSHSDRCII